MYKAVPFSKGSLVKVSPENELFMVLQQIRQNTDTGQYFKLFVAVIIFVSK